MLTPSDILFSSILPLVLGLSVAVFLSRFARSPSVPAIGAWTTLIAGYFGRFAVMNFAYARGETVTQKVVQTLSQTAVGLLNPPTAIQWIPIFATAALATTIIVARVESADSSKEPDDALPNSLFVGTLIYGLLVAVSAAAVVRLLWTSVYFTDTFTLAVKIRYVAVASVLIGTVWSGAFCKNCMGRKTFGQPVSRMMNVANGILSAAAMVTLACSGSFTIGLLQIPTLSAIIVGAIFHQTTARRQGLGGGTWLIASAVGLPVAIGFFFAEVRWEATALFATSAILVAWMPPLARDNNSKKVCTVVAFCIPAMIAAVWAAVELSQAIDSPYGGYQ